jgi:hypothetical protein
MNQSFDVSRVKVSGFEVSGFGSSKVSKNQGLEVSRNQDLIVSRF